MINKKLLSFDRGALRFVGANVAFQWLGMLCNVIFVRAIARLVGAAFAGMLTTGVLWQNLLLCLGTVPFRFVFTLLASGMSDQASKNVKRTLRSNIYDKLTRLGPNYTETAATSANAKRGSGPNSAQPAKAATATAMTAGTNHPDTWSAMRWIGARLRWACATICTICDSTVAAPTFSERITSAPLVLSVAPISLSPTRLVTGKGSPVSMDSSTTLLPSVTTPSTGTFSPGRTRSRSST